MGTTSRRRTGTGGFVHISEVLPVVMVELGIPDPDSLSRQSGREILAEIKKKIRTRELHRQPGGTWASKEV